ncbi:histone deacetylase 4 isoform X1 [Labeo rohita]|uniref:Histone deacetylase 4 isoform X1 n=1 Tax=Labeo rohita TaxID=84645 RepID=A0A498MRY1_LABRO|nr:histone deacetylase 4 isoform X1 [Labeo rohita]
MLDLKMRLFQAVIQYPDDLCFPDPQRYTAFLSWNGFSLSPTDGLPTKEQPLELLKPSGLNHIPPELAELQSGWSLAS